MKECVGNPETVTIFSPVDGSVKIEISEEEPTPKDKGYTFWYWTNQSKTRKYKSDCSGLSNCDTEILMSRTNTLQAIWRRTISDIPQETENNSAILLRIISIKSKN